MTESEAPITITLKAGTGYDAPWIVVRGYDPDDVSAKLRGIDSVVEATHEAAAKFAAGRALGATTVTGSSQDVTLQQQAPPTKQQGWGGQSRSNDGGPNRSKFGGQLHPEGKTCEICPNVLEKKQTSSGKNVWRCESWRWANGNPNGHTNIFID